MNPAIKRELNINRTLEYSDDERQLYIIRERLIFRNYWIVFKTEDGVVVDQRVQPDCASAMEYVVYLEGNGA